MAVRIRRSGDAEHRAAVKPSRAVIDGPDFKISEFPDTTSLLLRGGAILLQPAPFVKGKENAGVTPQ